MHARCATQARGPLAAASKFASSALLALACALAPGAVGAAAAPAACHPASPAVLAPLTHALAGARFVAYQPTSLVVIEGRKTRADAASMRADLIALRSRFDALVTYEATSGLEALPALAAELGFRALVIGVWDPFDATELDAALRAARAHPRLVVGISLGNELLFGRRATRADLVQALRAVRGRAPDVALSTTEPFHVLLDPANASLLEELDFTLANVHPVFEPWFRDAPDANAAQFVVNVVDRLAGATCGPVLVKETGVPTAPAHAGYTPARQATFYAALRAAFAPSGRRAFAYFSAFDAPWREHDWHPVPGPHPEEAHWGLFDAERRPKPAALAIPPLR